MTRSVPRIPKMIYGTAWKEEKTKDLVVQAVRAGFDAIDTANQKKHYREDYVGEALLELKAQGIARSSLFIQSKYTYLRGQDHRLPYDPKDPFAKQVRDSFQSTLRQLHTNYIDSYLIHGPYTAGGLHDADREVWRTMEDLCRSGKARKIGVSNFNFRQLEELFEEATIKPMFVQNRCYAQTGWDRAIREFCLDNEIVYQGFSLLTANPHVVNSEGVANIAERLGATPQQVIFAFCRQVGMLPITGTTRLQHMKEDLTSLDLKLSDSDVERIEGLGET